MKLSNIQGKGGKHCGHFSSVAKEALQERLGKDVDIKKDETDKNLYLTADGFKCIADMTESEKVNTITSAKELQEYSDNHIAELNEYRAANNIDGGKKIRSDAVVMCACICKIPEAFMKNLSHNEQIKICKDCVDIVASIVGKENIKAAVIHDDELVPHPHIFWEPMTKGKTKKGIPYFKLCAKEVHNLKYLGRLNREIPEQLRAKGWEQIDNCKAYDEIEEQKKREEMGEEAYREYRKEKRANRGKDSIDFKSDKEKEVAELQEEIAENQAELDDQYKRLAYGRMEIVKMEDEKKQVSKELSEKKSNLQEVSIELSEKQQAFNKVQDEALAYEQPPKKFFGESKKDYENRMATGKQAIAVKQRTEQQDEWETQRSERDAKLKAEEKRIATEKRKVEAEKAEVSESIKKANAYAAALQEEKKNISIEVERRTAQKLEKSERYSELLKPAEAWQKRYSEIFERGKANGSKDVETIKNSRNTANIERD